MAKELVPSQDAPPATPTPAPEAPARQAMAATRPGTPQAPPLTWRQMVYLLVLCERPLEPTQAVVAACQQKRPDARITPRTIGHWRERPAFRTLVDRIKSDPGFAANFLLGHTQVDAARRLRDILLDEESGGRVASDAAAQVLRASRESARDRSAFDFLDRLLRRATESKSD